MVQLSSYKLSGEDAVRLFLCDVQQLTGFAMAREKPIRHAATIDTEVLTQQAKNEYSRPSF